MKYALELGIYNGLITLPPESDINPLSTLGPKVNHDFKFNNSAYIAVEHPRWGFILSVMARRDIKKGEEIFTNYGYKTKEDFPLDYPWYWEAKSLHENEL